MRSISVSSTEGRRSPPWLAMRRTAEASRTLLHTLRGLTSKLSIHCGRLSLRGKNAQTGAVRDSLSTLRGPIFRTDYCPRKISLGKRHNQALIALLGQRTDVLFAMIHSRTGTLYSAINRPGNLTGNRCIFLITHRCSLTVVAS